MVLNNWKLKILRIYNIFFYRDHGGGGGKDEVDMRRYQIAIFKSEKNMVTVASC